MRLMRFHRPIGILLILWPVLWALWVSAEGLPNLHLSVVFILGTVIMRAAGCVINDYCDRHFDGYVQRTQDRPLATGELSPCEAQVLFVCLSLLAIALLFTLPVLTRWLALPAALLTLIYPLMKRYTHLPQLVLAVAFACSILMVFSAQTGSLPWQAWCLFVADILWCVAYDTIYAMADRICDLKIGIRSTAILFGRQTTGFIAVLHVGVLVTLVLFGLWQHYTYLYYLGLSAAGAIFGYQQYLIYGNTPKQCEKAFAISHYVGLVVFLGLLFA